MKLLPYQGLCLLLYPFHFELVLNCHTFFTILTSSVLRLMIPNDSQTATEQRAVGKSYHIRFS